MEKLLYYEPFPIESRHRKYQWKIDPDETQELNRELYVAGQPIWIYYTEQEILSYLELPIQFNSGQRCKQDFWDLETSDFQLYKYQMMSNVNVCS